MLGSLKLLSVESGRLRGNPLGDPWQRDIPVYLPPGYEHEPERRYPCIYWLHGFASTALSALQHHPWTPSLPEMADALIARGEAPPFVLVMVDGFTRYGGSQFINSSATGQYEDYLVHDLIPSVEAAFRIRAEGRARGIAGKSSGGYGALVLGMRHPDRFAAIASHSGDMYFEYCYLPEFPKFLNTVTRYGSVDQFLSAFLELPKKSSELVTAVNIAAMAMAYSPNPHSASGFDLPFDLASGEISSEVWARWLEHDPVRLAPRHASALQALKLLYLECGTRDEYQLHFGARILARRLRELEVNFEHLEFDDGHGNTNYRYPESLRRLARALAGEGDARD